MGLSEPLEPWALSAPSGLFWPLEPEPPELTKRQLDILGSLARGQTNRDIALQLGLKPSGVRVHIDAILSKLGAATRTEAMAIAMRKHLLKP